MSKWIAEFELEDGDRMPEHMDLNYKGAKIDFYCRSLEQDIVKPVLDKIREEIVKKHLSVMEKNDFESGRTYGYEEILEIIDKYKTESEDK